MKFIKTFLKMIIICLICIIIIAKIDHDTEKPNAKLERLLKKEVYYTNFDNLEKRINVIDYKHSLIFFDSGYMFFELDNFPADYYSIDYYSLPSIKSKNSTPLIDAKKCAESILTNIRNNHEFNFDNYELVFYLENSLREIVIYFDSDNNLYYVLLYTRFPRFFLNVLIKTDTNYSLFIKYSPLCKYTIGTTDSFLLF